MKEEKKYYLKPAKRVAPKALGFITTFLYIAVVVLLILIVKGIIDNNIGLAIKLFIGFGISILTLLIFKFAFAWYKGYEVTIHNSNDIVVRIHELIQTAGIADTKYYIRSIKNLIEKKNEIIVEGEIYVYTGLKKASGEKEYKERKISILGVADNRDELISKLKEKYE